MNVNIDRHQSPNRFVVAFEVEWRNDEFKRGTTIDLKKSQGILKRIRENQLYFIQKTMKCKDIKTYVRITISQCATALDESHKARTFNRVGNRVLYSNRVRNSLARKSKNTWFSTGILNRKNVCYELDFRPGTCARFRCLTLGRREKTHRPRRDRQTKRTKMKRTRRCIHVRQWKMRKWNFRNAEIHNSLGFP